MTSVEEATVMHGALRDYVTLVFARLGLPEEDAALVADSLVEADLRGVHSHGMLMVPGYAGRIKRGEVNLRPRIKTVRENKGTLLVDGDNGMGQVVAKYAMELVIGKARQTGVGVVGVAHSSHYAAGAYWALKAVAQNMIGFALTGTGAAIAPWGGRTKILGTNPWTIAVPAGTAYPVVLDMATSVVAAGKLAWAAERGEKVPVGWALDPDERPTDDPKRGLAGRLLPFGSYKGYGLMVMVDLLASLLSGGDIGPEVSSAVRDGRDLNIGHYFQAIDVSSFMPVDTFKARVDDYVQLISQSEREAGSEQVLLPGEREFRLADERRQSGIPMPRSLMTAIKTIGNELGIEAPW
jgi:LDH2 family malate/lactate/ureidoglycolate dehydrogenase